MKQRFISIAIAAVAAVFSGQASADALTDQAQAFLGQGKAQAAYELLAPEESRRAGDPDYDFLLGLAALEVGKNTNAVFALERVLAVNPGHVRARAEIARAYAALGETRTAKQEFETVKRQGVPPEVAATIDRLLSAIERIEDQGRTTVRGYLEATGGYDTNVNSATSSSSVAVPLFGGAIFTLASTGVKLDDTFVTLAGGVNLRSPLDREWAITAGVSANKRVNGSEDRFDTGAIDGNVGVVKTQGKDVYSIALQNSNFRVDNARYRDALGFAAQWQRNHDARNQGSLYFQYSALSYPAQSVRDADRFVLGANYAHALPGFRTVVYGGAHAADERAQDSLYPHLGHTALGGRIGAQHNHRDDVTAFANLGYENRRYGGRDPFFLTTRSDDQWNLGVGAVWTPSKEWRVTPQFQYTDNRSNIAINKYTREVVSVTVRREF